MIDFSKLSKVFFTGGLFASCCAAFGLVIGLLSLCGWIFHSAPLIQLDSGFAPMQFNTSVSIVVLGAALICVCRGCSAPAKILLVLPVLVSVATLGEYLFNRDFGIDNIIFQPFIAVTNSHPGRMSPNTGLSILFTCVAITTALKKRFSSATFLCALFGSVLAIALPILALLGYITDFGAKYGWAGLTRMGVNTSVVLIVYSAANLTLLYARAKARNASSLDGLSFFTGIAGFALSILLWQTLLVTEKSKTETLLSDEARTITSELSSQLDSHLKALRRIANRWEVRGGTPYDEWVNDTENYIRDQPSYLAISWIDPSFHLKWVYPLKGNEAFVGYDLSQEPERKRTLELAKATHEPAISKNIKLLIGGEGFLFAVPLYTGEKFDGFITGGFRTSKFVEGSVYHQEKNIHSLLITEDGKEIYGRNVGQRINEKLSIEPLALSQNGLDWKIKVWFEPQNVPGHSFLSEIALGAGIILTVLLSSVLQLRRRSEDHATQLENTHKALHLQTKKFQSAFDYASHGMAIISPRGGWIKVNRALCEMFGYEERELLTKALKEITYPEDYSKDLALLNECLNGQREAFQLEKRYIHKNGQILWVLLSVSIVQGESNKPLHFIAQIQDITAQKEAETALKDAALFRQTLLDSSKYSIISCDTTGAIQTFNRAAEQMLGYSRSEMVGINTPAVFHLEKEVVARAEILSKELRCAIAPGFEVFTAKLDRNEVQVDDNEWTYVRKDGSSFPVNLSASALRDHLGKIVGYMGVAEDISERKRSQAELAQARDNAMAATEAKSQFLANTSHEIRTPLTSVIGFAETILAGGLSADEQQQAIASIIRNGKHLLRVLNDILDLSKIEAGKMDLEVLQTDLFGLLSDVGNMMRHRADETSIQLSFEYAYPLPTTIRTDPTRLKQILVNLLSNALNSAQLGSVKVHVKYLPETEQVAFAVQDTGIGLTGEQQSKLFQAFSQADTATTRKFGGTGLGLVISSQLAKKMGGAITIHSEKGVGSTFTAIVSTGTVLQENLVNSRPTKTLQAAPAAAELSQRFSGKILLVEDGPDNQQYISFVLRKAGVEVTMCENGAEALKAAEKQDFDLILMDVQMPVMDGYTATRMLRQSGYKKPIVALTANFLKVDIEKSLSAGCDDYLGKPFERAAFLAKLSTYLKKPDATDVGVRSSRAMEYITDDVEMLNVFAAFIDRLPVRIALMERHVAEGNRAELGACAHQLKGAAGNLGYDMLTRAAGALESASLEPELNLEEFVRHLKSIVASLGDEGDRLRKFASGLPNQLLSHV